MVLIMMELNFLCQKKVLPRLKKTTTFAITCFVIKTNWLFQFTFQIINLKIVIYENKSHYVYIKDFNRYMFHKTKIKKKRYFCKKCLQYFSCKNVLTKHIKDFNRYMLHKTKNKKKKYFCKSCLQYLICKHVLTKHKEFCLSINGAQSVRLEKRNN